MEYTERVFADSSSYHHIRLGTFIRENAEHIVHEWTRFAETWIPASEGMTKVALRDHVDDIFRFIADDLEISPVKSTLSRTAGDGGSKRDGAQSSAAEVHAALRLNDGFDIDQMVSEYRHLRACVLELWSKRATNLDRRDFDDLIRFNTAVDQAVAESLRRYTKTVDSSRQLFLGIFGHDLRTPLAAVLLSADRMAEFAAPDTKQAVLAKRIKRCTSRAIGVLDDLLDLTRTHFGSGIPIFANTMDLSRLGKQMMDEMRAAYPNRAILLNTAGDLVGEWDIVRIGQVLSNLIGNALEHGFDDTPVEVRFTGEPDSVMLLVRNDGLPIPESKIRTIFNSFARGDADRQESAGSTHLGLGLHISRKIVGAHGGTLGVTSTAEGGTTFTAIMPRKQSSSAIDRT